MIGGDGGPIGDGAAVADVQSAGQGRGVERERSLSPLSVGPVPTPTIGRQSILE